MGDNPERVTVSYSIVSETDDPAYAIMRREQVESVTVTRDSEIGAVAAAILHLIETRGAEFRTALDALLGNGLAADLVAVNPPEPTDEVGLDRSRTRAG